jgi:NAD(P)-dependent dehydrogenase (short-subunit alcohol dehydrogenase family)
LHQELAATNVHVHLVCPGFVNTKFLEPALSLIPENLHKEARIVRHRTCHGCVVSLMKEASIMPHACSPPPAHTHACCCVGSLPAVWACRTVQRNSHVLCVPLHGCEPR